MSKSIKKRARSKKNRYYEPYAKKFKPNTSIEYTECARQPMRIDSEPYICTNIKQPFMKIGEYYYKTHYTNVYSDTPFIQLNHVQNCQLNVLTTSSVVNVLPYKNLLLANAKSFGIKIIDAISPCRIDVDDLEKNLIKKLTGIPIISGQKFMFETSEYQIRLSIKSINNNDISKLSYFVGSSTKLEYVNAINDVIVYKNIDVLSTNVNVYVENLHSVDDNQIYFTSVNKYKLTNAISKYLATIFFCDQYKFKLTYDNIEYDLKVDLFNNSFIKPKYLVLYKLESDSTKVNVYSCVSNLHMHKNKRTADVIKFVVYRMGYVKGDKNAYIDINRLEHAFRQRYTGVASLNDLKLAYDTYQIKLRPFDIYPSTTKSTYYKINKETILKFQVLDDEPIVLLKTTEPHQIDNIIMKLFTPDTKVPLVIKSEKLTKTIHKKYARKK